MLVWTARGALQKLELVEEDAFELGNRFAITFEIDGQQFAADLHEIEVYRSIYTHEHLFNATGIEGCVTIDIALAKGGTEAMVESYYSVMISQKMSGGQQNETLALR